MGIGTLRRSQRDNVTTQEKLEPKQDLSKLNKDELVKLAKEKELEFDSKATKAELIELLK